MPASSSTKVLVAAALWSVPLLVTPRIAAAQDVPFAFLITNGWKTFSAGQALRTDQGLASWFGYGSLHAIANGQKGPSLGVGYIQAFALFSPSNILQASYTGTWILGDGSGIAGGTADDMVVGVLLHQGSAQFIGNVPVEIQPYFPYPSFANDFTFSKVTENVLGPSGTWLGSGQLRPVLDLGRGPHAGPALGIRLDVPDIRTARVPADAPDRPAGAVKVVRDAVPH